MYLTKTSALAAEEQKILYQSNGDKNNLLRKYCISDEVVNQVCIKFSNVKCNLHNFFVSFAVAISVCKCGEGTTSSRWIHPEDFCCDWTKLLSPKLLLEYF